MHAARRSASPGIGLFPHLQVSFHTCTSLFTYTGSGVYHRAAAAVHAAFLFFVQVSFHIYRSLFTYLCTGLFSHIQVSFHIYRSLFTYTGLGGCACRVSFFRSLSPDLILFHIRSFFTSTGLFPHIYFLLYLCREWSM